jgi:hypothetical protein
MLEIRMMKTNRPSFRLREDATADNTAGEARYAIRGERRSR